MSNRQLRITIRWIHLIGGALIAASIYSPTLHASETMTAILRFGVLPLLIVSGVVLWQQPKIMKLFRGGQQMGTGTNA